MLLYELSAVFESRGDNAHWEQKIFYTGLLHLPQANVTVTKGSIVIVIYLNKIAIRLDCFV